MSRISKMIGMLACVLPVLFAVGCAKPQINDLKKFVAKEKTASPSQIEPIPEIRQIETFLYDHQDRRDPFAPSSEQPTAERTVVESGIAPDFNRRKEELESYSLDTLRMVGTLEQNEIAWALVQTKEGTIHRVRSGNHMGRNYGRITQISEEKINLTEIVQDGLGSYRERPASLALTE